MLNKDFMGIYPFILSSLGDMKLHTQIPQMSSHPGDVFTGKSKTFKRNLRAVQKAQKRRAFYRSLRK